MFDFYFCDASQYDNNNNNKRHVLGFHKITQNGLYVCMDDSEESVFYKRSNLCSVVV